MAKHTRQDFISESLILRFLTAPLKWLKILLLVTFILFGSSIALQIYFHQPDLLQQEMDATEKLGQQSLWKQWAQDIATDDRIKNQSATGINLILTKHIYHAFSTVLYEWIPVNYLLSAQPGDAGYDAKERILEPGYDYLERFDQTIRIISLRLGNIIFLSILAVYLTVLTAADGLVQRRIRQENASRESAGIYHRAKYWRIGIISSSMLLYLSCPWPLSPLWLLIPIASGAAMVFLQTKYLKKYL